MFGRHLSGQWKAGRSRPAILLGTLLAALTAGPAAHAVTFVTVDGHPNPVTLVAGETVIIRFDVATPGGSITRRFARDLTRTGTHDFSAPVFQGGSGSWTDGGGGDVDPSPGKVAMPLNISPGAAAGPYVLHLADSSDGSSLDLPGVTVVPRPQAQGITGRVAVLFPAGGGFVPDDAVVWAYADAQTPVASASIQRDGSYALPLPPGSYVVFAEWLGDLRSQREFVNVFAAQITGIDLALIQGQEVAGTVRRGGQPVSGAAVQALTAGRAVVDTQTLVDGSYVLVLPAGKSRVFAGGMTADVTVVDGPVDGVDFPPAAPGATPGAGTIVTVVGNGIAGYGGDGGPATAARLSGILELAVDKAGNLYFSSNSIQRVRKVDAQTGIITTIAGSSPFVILHGLASAVGGGGYGGDGGPATQALFNNPQHLAVDAAGNLYVADSANQRVRKIDSSGTITTVVGTGKQGFAGDGGPAAAAQLNSPQGIAFDAAGNLFIVESGNRRVRKVSPKGIITTVAGGGTDAVKDGAQGTAVALGTPRELAVDKEGNLFIGDAGLVRILKMSPAGILTLIAGTGTAGFSGDGGPATQAQFNSNFPRMTVDSAGNLFFVEIQNNRVRKIRPDGIITTVAGSGPVFPDSGSFAGDGGPAIAARLGQPQGIGIDAAGNLYILDTSNNRIRKVMGIAAPGLVAGQ